MQARVIFTVSCTLCFVWCVQAGDADGDVLTVYSQRDSWVVLVVSRRSQSGRKVEASGWSPPLRTMAAFVSCVQMPVVRGGAQLDLHCWRTVRCLKHQAQSASDGRRARRRAESRPEPARASLLVRRNSWSQLVATSRQAARRDEHPRGLRPARRLRCCGGTAEQVRAAVAGPWLGHRPTRANAIAGFESLNKDFAGEARTFVAKEKNQKKNPPPDQTPCGRDKE